MMPNGAIFTKRLQNLEKIDNLAHFDLLSLDAPTFFFRSHQMPLGSEVSALQIYTYIHSVLKCPLGCIENMY